MFDERIAQQKRRLGKIECQIAIDTLEAKHEPQIAAAVAKKLPYASDAVVKIACGRAFNTLRRDPELDPYKTVAALARAARIALETATMLTARY